MLPSLNEATKRGFLAPYKPQTPMTFHQSSQVWPSNFLFGSRLDEINVQPRYVPFDGLPPRYVPIGTGGRVGLPLELASVWMRWEKVLQQVWTAPFLPFSLQMGFSGAFEGPATVSPRQSNVPFYQTAGAGPWDVVEAET